MKKRLGVSLIVLVVTIIVIIILASAVILALTNNNPISQATEALFKSNVDSYNSELLMAISNEYLLNRTFDPNKFNKGIWEGGSIEGTIKQYIPSITNDDALKFEIQKGKLVYVATNEIEENWIIDMGMIKGFPIPPYIELGLNVIATGDATFDGQAATYSNPIIPKGFMAVNSGTTWPDNWNDGLVIEDEAGNQFVWVPVDGTNVTYEKWTTSGITYSDPSIGNAALPDGVVEQNQIEKYQGFYIARYEAMFDYNSGNIRAASKKSLNTSTPSWPKNETYNGYLWNWTTYLDAKLYSENMAQSYGYDSNKVVTHLLTGTQWDTVMRWIQNSGKNVADSKSWGNHSNSVSPANVTGFSSLQVSGFSEYWKVKNIYDISGNAWEWTAESFATSYILRGGFFYSSTPAASRDNASEGSAADQYGFRVALYIK